MVWSAVAGHGEERIISLIFQICYAWKTLELIIFKDTL